MRFDRFWKKPALMLALSMIASSAFNQESEAFQTLKKYYFSLPALVKDSNWLITPIDTGGMNYLLPIRQGLQREKKLTIIDTTAFYDMMSDALCRLTDYKSSLWYEKKITGTLSREEQHLVSNQAIPFRTASTIDATSFVLQQTAAERIVVVNASYLKPYTYVWLASMLDSLKQQGYRHLALELLSPSKEPIKEIGVANGLFTTEPVLAEFIRLAIASGFSVISCQPDYSIKNPHKRKKNQALQLGNYFSKISSTEKLVVITQPELMVSADNNNVQPLSLYLSSLRGVPCLSIDQCTLSAGSVDAAGAWLYEWLSYQKPIDRPVVPLQKNMPLLWNEAYYSFMVWHPEPAFQNQRAVWLGFNGKRKTIALPAAHARSWLVQAFYLEEISKKRAGNCVPADQTYQLAADGNYYLYLQPGKYRIIYRNKDNEVLTFRDIEVNR
jgi:hypothetical protein